VVGILSPQKEIIMYQVPSNVVTQQQGNHFELIATQQVSIDQVFSDLQQASQNNGIVQVGSTTGTIKNLSAVFGHKLGSGLQQGQLVAFVSHILFDM
jgi:hypothetical protein